MRAARGHATRSSPSRPPNRVAPRGVPRTGSTGLRPAGASRPTSRRPPTGSTGLRPAGASRPSSRAATRAGQRASDEGRGADDQRDARAGDRRPDRVGGGEERAVVRGVGEDGPVADRGAALAPAHHPHERARDDERAAAVADARRAGGTAWRALRRARTCSQPAGALVEPALPPADVMPRAVLAPDGLEHADRREAEALVQGADAGLGSVTPATARWKPAVAQASSSVPYSARPVPRPPRPGAR